MNGKRWWERGRQKETKQSWRLWYFQRSFCLIFLYTEVDTRAQRMCTRFIQQAKRERLRSSFTYRLTSQINALQSATWELHFPTIITPICKHNCSTPMFSHLIQFGSFVYSTDFPHHSQTELVGCSTTLLSFLLPSAFPHHFSISHPQRTTTQPYSFIQSIAQHLTLDTKREYTTMRRKHSKYIDNIFVTSSLLSFLSLMIGLFSKARPYRPSFYFFFFFFSRSFLLSHAIVFFLLWLMDKSERKLN